MPCDHGSALAKFPGMVKKLFMYTGGALVVLTVVHYGKTQLIQVINLIDSIARLLPFP